MCNRRHESSCLSHPGAKLKHSDPACPVIFVYVRPATADDNEDEKNQPGNLELCDPIERNKRWLGIISDDTERKPLHNHPMPVESKIDSKVYLNYK